MRLGFRKLLKTPSWRWWMRFKRGIHYANYPMTDASHARWGYVCVAYRGWLRAYYSLETGLLLIYTEDGI